MSSLPRAPSRRILQTLQHFLFHHQQEQAAFVEIAHQSLAMLPLYRDRVICRKLPGFLSQETHERGFAAHWLSPRLPRQLPLTHLIRRKLLLPNSQNPQKQGVGQKIRLNPEYP